VPVSGPVMYTRCKHFHVVSRLAVSGAIATMPIRRVPHLVVIRNPVLAGKTIK